MIRRILPQIGYAINNATDMAKLVSITELERSELSAQKDPKALAAYLSQMPGACAPSAAPRPLRSAHRESSSW